MPLEIRRMLVPLVIAALLLLCNLLTFGVGSQLTPVNLGFSGQDRQSGRHSHQTHEIPARSGTRQKWGHILTRLGIRLA
jgi:hypothetical protein